MKSKNLILVTVRTLSMSCGGEDPLEPQGLPCYNSLSKSIHDKAIEASSDASEFQRPDGF